MRTTQIGRWLGKNNKPFVALLAAGATLAMATLIDASSSSQIEQLGLLAVPRTGHAATALADGRVLITGGRDTAGIIVATAEVFDPANETSTAIGVLNTARIDHTATLLADGRVLIAGGTSASEALTSVEIFDPANPGAGFRVLSATMAAARTRHTATRLHNGTVLIAGGDAAGTAEIFNPTTETFSSALLAMAAPRIGHTATLFSDDSVLLAGGNTDSMEYFSSIDQTFTLDPAKLTATRTGHDAISLSDTRLLFFGGDTGHTIDEFNPSADTLSLKATMDSASSSATLLANGRILVLRPDAAGLYAPDATDQATAFTLFDETSVPGSTALKRAGQTATELSGDKKILVAGGENAQHQPMLQIATFNPAKIWTDKDDYQPDDPVILSGSGWKANENIYLFAVDSETDQWTYESTIPADGNGEFSANPYFIVQLRQLGTQFHVTAMGAQSTLQADVHFTDTTSQVTNIGFDRTGPTNFTSGAANGALGVELLNASNSGEKLTGNTNSTVTITITSSSGTGRFDTTVGGSFSTSSLVQTITSSSPNPLNPDFPDFFYKDSAVGSVTLTATVTAEGTNVANLPLNTTTTLIKQLQAATSMAVSPAAGTFGGTVTLTATLTVGGSGVNGKTIAFTLNGTSVGSATTNSSGVATLNNVSLSGINTGTYTGGIVATFTADGSGYLGSSGNATLTVSKASSTTTVTVSDAVYDGAPHGGTANVTGAGGLSQSLTVSYSGRNGTTYGPSTTAPSSAGDYSASANYAGDTNHNGSNDSKNYSITKKSATWTTDDASKTYGDADPNPLTTGSGSGFVAGDNVTATYTRASGESVTGGPYHITANLSPSAVLANYNITNAGANFTINKKDATWTTNDASKIYGDADPNPLTTGSGSGFLAGDNVTATYTRATGESVAGGPYHITATLNPAAAVANYNVTNTGANFTINKKNATWTTNNASKTYGDADPDPLTTGSGSGFLAADNITADYTRASGETVAGGPYHITATLKPAAAAANYDVTNNGANFAINARAATWTTNPNSKTYGDSDPDPLTTGGGDFLAADNVTATYSRVAGETVAGSPYHITATLHAAAGVLANYIITNNGANFAINARPATWTTNPNSKTYGDSDPDPLTTGSGDFLAADNVTATYSRATGETVAGSPYHITATLHAAAGVLANYIITNNGANFTINARPATWTTNPNSKTYGDNDPNPLTTGSGDFLAADNVTATYSRVAGESVTGSPYHITATLHAAAGVLANYIITNNGANFTINARPATWTTNPNSKTYGDNDPNPLTTGSGDFLAADNITATYSRAPGESVTGSPYHITAILNAAAGVLANYIITNAGASFTINARPATWTTNPNSKTYGDNDPNPLTTGSGDFLAADNVTASYSRVAGETVVGSPYHITATLNAAAEVLANYIITNVGADFTINARPATWTTNPNSKTYGDNDPNPLTSGSGDFLAADSVTATYSRAPGESVSGGPYHITATLNAAAEVLANYIITNVGADFTINARPATWTTNPNSKTYGDNDPNPLTTGSGDFLAADSVTATYSRAPGESVTGSPYHITATLSAAAGVLANYIITSAGTSFTINARPATWTTNANSKTYGDLDPNPLTTGSGTGFLAADNVTATYSRAAGETVLGGPYHITTTLAPAGVLSNYAITNTGANFTINTRPATWTTNANSKTYGELDPNPLTTGSGSNFVAADNVSAIYTRTAGETVLGGPYHITATLSPAGVLSNYVITNTGGSFTINTRPATWTTNNNSKTYGAQDPNPVTTGSAVAPGSGAGFLVADGVTATYSRVAGENASPPTYHISATLAPAGVLSNYSMTNAGAEFTINKAHLTVTANDKTKVFDNTPYSPFAATVSGFVNGETDSGLRSAGALSGAAAFTGDAIPAYLPGAYTITPTIGTLAATNYDFTPFTNGKLTITYGTCGGSVPGILPPINSDGTSVYQRKGGSTIPVKFQVCDAFGNPISNPSAVFGPNGGATITMLSAVRGTVDTVNEVGVNTIPDAGFRYTGGQWIFNMATTNLAAGTTYTFRINLAYDPASIVFKIGVK